MGGGEEARGDGGRGKLKIAEAKRAGINLSYAAQYFKYKTRNMSSFSVSLLSVTVDGSISG